MWGSVERLLEITGAGVAELVSARPSELDVPGSIQGDSNVCFDFLLICVALALNTRKMEHRQRKGGKVRTEGHKFISNYCHVLPSLNKVALPLPFN